MVNVRLLDDEAAAALASIALYDDSFTRRRLYTASDSLGDEEHRARADACRQLAYRRANRCL